MSGKGTIYSYEIIVHAIQAGFREIAPYAVVVVELDEQRGVPTEHEGLRLVANLLCHIPSRPPRSRAGWLCDALARVSISGRRRPRGRSRWSRARPHQ